MCIALRGEPDDYEQWAAVAGPAWSWSVVEAVFRALEDDELGEPSHGRGGPVPIRRILPSRAEPLHRAAFDALCRMGFQIATDLNASGSSGVGPRPMNRVDGIRQSSAHCFLSDVRMRPNLKILPHHEVRRLRIRNTAVHEVDAMTPAGPRSFDADHVWLCAGAINTPTLLLRSGIGPARHLQEVGVRCVVDLPGVGQNLLDHPAVLLVATSGAACDPAHMMQFGARASSGRRLGCFNDLQLGPAVIRDLPGFPDVLAVLVGLYAPRSIGSLGLDPENPSGPPNVRLGHLTDRADLERMLIGLRHGWTLLHTEPLASLLDAILQPNAATMEHDDRLADYARQTCGTFHHPVGTARMGPASDPLAVVEHRGTVHQLGGLHIVDASIMPTIPRANTNLPTMMLAVHALELALASM